MRAQFLSLTETKIFAVVEVDEKNEENGEQKLVDGEVDGRNVAANTVVQTLK